MSPRTPQGKGPTLTIFTHLEGFPKRTINSMVGKEGVRGINALYD